ncbi:hypothetical protein [Neptunomonas sp.]|uniref:hypothetical protein n=1 Tax=Neptunomonas sp. TaxID=1971898 RepID=UPI00356A8453
MSIKDIYAQHALTSNIIRVKPLPPKSVPHRVSNFSVTTDSVVAKATIVTSSDTRRISIDWGDGHNDTIRIRPGRIFSVQQHLAGTAPDPLPEGTYEMYHAYDEPEDRREFSRIVLLNVEDRDGGNDVRLREIFILPKYRVSHYQARFQIPEPCDVGREIQKFTVSMHLGENPFGNWELDIPNNPAGSVIWHLLENSHFSTEVSSHSTEGGSTMVSFRVSEDDSLFDDSGSTSFSVNYNAVTEQVERQISLSDAISETCRIVIRFDREVTLIANMPTPVGPVAYAGP